MSAASDTASNYHDPEDVPNVEPSSDPTFELTWQDLHHCTQHIDGRDWSNTSAPAILDAYPENIVISEQLERILSWSLQRFESVSTDQSTAQSTARSSLDDTESTPYTTSGTVPDTTPEAAPEAIQQLQPTRSNTVLTPAIVAVDAPILLARAKSHRTVPLVARLNKLRQDVANKIASTGLSRSTGANNPHASSSQTTATEITPLRECISCFDELPKRDVVHLECSHDYCKPCLREVVFTAIKNEAAFPPKCCLTEIPLRSVLVCLDNKQRTEYREKSAEYAIPAGHRWYCPQTTCSKWIRPESLQRDRRTPQICPHCKASICSMCRALAHDTNQDCPQDFGLESTLEIAESEGWRRCYSCRTMVELTTGCRHITCRCGAEFCYVCNAVWRTCNCTEADKERRIRELRVQREERAQMQEEERRRREEEDDAARLEAEEMAEALRQVEELERQDAIKRVEVERRQQLEEELALARLEEARLLEEIARREAEEEAERQFRQILIESSKEECQAMMKTLMDIINHQRAALMSSHATQEQTLMERYEVRKAQESSQLETWLIWLQENIQKRAAALNTKQKSEWDALLLQIETEEDEMFMDMHIHLRGKPNREQREKRMRDLFQKQQQERTENLQRRHHTERDRHEMGISYEIEGLQKAASVRAEPLEREHITALEKFGGQVGHERQWLQIVSTRRINLLSQHKRIVLEQLEAEEEPTGLTEEQARLIEPVLPAVQDHMASQLQEAASYQEMETTDLYGAASDGVAQSNITSGPISLNRSNTVVRSPPNTSPVLVVSRPTQAPTTRLAGLTSPRILLGQQDVDAITTILNSSSALMNAPENPSGSSTTELNPSISNPTTSPETKHLSTDSHSSTSASTTSSSSTALSITSSETSTSTSPSILDEIPTTIVARHSIASESSVKGKGKGITGMFRRGKKKELSEDEIRERMRRSAVGDSLGGGWGAFG